MITLNGRTKLTTEAEKRLVELGGENPQRTLTSEELASAIVKGQAVMAQQGRTRTLEKLYLSYRREDPTLVTAAVAGIDSIAGAAYFCACM